MGLFDGILICTDLDGTLYRNDKSISEENKEAIEFFKCEGGSFTFITGRLPYYSTDAYEVVRPNVPFGCINGGGVYDGEAERYIWTVELPREALELARYIDGLFPDVGVQLCRFDKTLFVKENKVTEIFRQITGLPYIAGDYDTTEPLAKILFCTHRWDELLAVERALREHELADRFDFICSEKNLFELLPKGVNKGLALRKLAEHLGIDMSRTVAIGDYDNDAAMLKMAGRGIAVSNASERALRAADVVTVSNEEHAIARVIYDLRDKKIELDK